MMDERDALMEEMQRQQEEQQKQALSKDAYESGGITGGQEVKDAKVAPDYTKLGQYAGKLQGYDMSKFDRPYDQLSEKYKIGLVQSHFNPLEGVSQGYTDALNSLDIAGFSGSGDKLSVTNTKNDPRFGRGGMADVVKGLKGQNADTAWQPWFVDDNPASAGPQRGPSYMGGDGLTTSDAVQALTQGSAYNDMVKRLQEILGPASVDRNALMSMLQR